MNTEKIKEDIIDLYYGESNLSLKEIAVRHGVSLEDCQQELKAVLLVSQVCRSLPQHVPSQISINKITAHAREKVMALQRKSFWPMFRPAYAVALVFVMGIAISQIWMTTHSPDNGGVDIAFKHQTDSDSATQVKERLFMTPLDNSSFSQPYSLNKSGAKYFFPNISAASVGNEQGDYALAEALDQKMISNNLTLQDIETLYFRARKFEQQGYFQEALHDYVFLARNYPSFKYQKALPLAIARCYEELGNKQTALSILLDYERLYGSTEDIKFWKDQLKSETF
ncbi:MAG: hypothetical protein HQM16_01965 [Deltaproteobacteria bacterium]|nr:hypothetical protein [Deltaproteobacteria bacterium]